MSGALGRAWLDAVRRADVAAALEAVYARASTAIAERGPACWASGRCCNFDRAGHRLYVTGLEAAYVVAHLPLVAGTREGNFARATIDGRDLDEARARGGCPFQVSNLCGVHAIKPLGCRVYFCDRSAQAWQQDLSEDLLAEVRRIHDAFGVEYRYGEWRAMLAEVC